MGYVEGDLVLQVKLLAEPCLWYWEIRDGADDRLVESSWANEWVAFGSRADAVAAGAKRLAELAGSDSRGNLSCRRPAQRIATNPTRRAG